MWKKGCNDPNADVFVLKLGQTDSADKAQGAVELELRTPKCPELGPKPKNTVAVQVLEDEFEDLGKSSKGSENGGGKPGKGKGKGKKGKKK